jgi:hypothetical protein
MVAMEVLNQKLGLNKTIRMGYKMVIYFLVNLAFLSYSLGDAYYTSEDTSIYGGFGVSKGSHQDEFDEMQKSYYIRASSGKYPVDDYHIQNFRYKAFKNPDMMEYYEATGEVYDETQKSQQLKMLPFKVMLSSSIGYLIIFTLFSIMMAKTKTPSTKWIAVASFLFAYCEATYKQDPYYDEVLLSYWPNTFC